MRSTHRTQEHSDYQPTHVDKPPLSIEKTSLASGEISETQFNDQCEEVAAGIESEFLAAPVQDRQLALPKTELERDETVAHTTTRPPPRPFR